MKIDAQFLLDHPLPISVVSGVANGLIYKLRGKKVDFKTAATLCAVQGMGEAALVMYEKPEDRGPVLRDMSILSVGIWSTVGLFFGLIPFMKWDPYAFKAQDSRPLSVPPPAEPPPAAIPVAGFGSAYARGGARKKSARRR